MVFVDVFLILSMFLLTIPAVCGYYAYSRGRSFWLWFLLGACLPVVAHLILVFLPDKTNVFEKELDELRLQLGVLGTVADKTANRKVDKLLHAEKQKIRFQINTINERKVVEIFVNDIDLKHLVKNIETEEINQYEGIPIALFNPTSLHLLGEPDDGYGDNEQRAALLICKSDAYFRSALMAKIEITRKHIIWHSFQRNQKPNNQYNTISFAFNKIQYMNALDKIQQQITLV